MRLCPKICSFGIPFASGVPRLQQDPPATAVCYSSERVHLLVSQFEVSSEAPISRLASADLIACELESGSFAAFYRRRLKCPTLRESAPRSQCYSLSLNSAN